MCLDVCVFNKTLVFNLSIHNERPGNDHSYDNNNSPSLQIGLKKWVNRFQRSTQMIQSKKSRDKPKT